MDAWTLVIKYNCCYVVVAYAFHPSTQETQGQPEQVLEDSQSYTEKHGLKKQNKNTQTKINNSNNNNKTLIVRIKILACSLYFLSCFNNYVV